MNTLESSLEESLVTKLQDLKYEYRPVIRDRATLEQNSRELEALIPAIASETGKRAAIVAWN